MLYGCHKKDDNTTTGQQTDLTVTQLQQQVTSLQAEINNTSNIIDSLLQDETKNYLSEDVAKNIALFRELRLNQKQKLKDLAALGHDSGLPVISCTDFEDPDCFNSHWDVLQCDDRQTLGYDVHVSYNNSTSLYLTSPYITPDGNEWIDLKGMVNNIRHKNEYKLRWWAKYKGRKTVAQGAIMYVYVSQDNDAIDYKYIGIQTPDGQVTDEDWQLYTFTFTANTDSPVTIEFLAQVEECWIDDMHLVKRAD